MAAAAARASVTPLGVATRTGAAPPPDGAAPPPSLAPPIASHPGFIGGKIVDSGTLGMIGVPDSTNGSDAVHTESAQWRDVLWNDAADGEDRKT